MFRAVGSERMRAMREEQRLTAQDAASVLHQDVPELIHEYRHLFTSHGLT